MTKPNLGTFGAFGHHSLWQQLSPAAAAGHRGPRLRGHLGGRLTSGRAVVGRSHPRADQHAEAGHRHRQHLDRGTPARPPSRSTASRRPTPAASCSASASATPRRTQEYRKPIDALTDYLDKLDEYGVPKDRRVVAALGAEGAEAVGASAAAGAHPYLTTPEHTAEARELIGPEAFLAPEHKVVLTTDAEKARAVGRKALEIYLNLANYLNNWKRLGLHRRRRGQAGQRPPGRRRRRVRHGRRDRGAAEGAPRRRRRPRAGAGADRYLTSWCLHSPNWPGRSACSESSRPTGGPA